MISAALQRVARPLGAIPPVLLLASVPICFARQEPAQLSMPDYPLKPVPFNEVKLTDDFWLPRLRIQRDVLVPHAFEQTRPGVAHLQAAADFLAGKLVNHKPHRYIDSDLYKVMEGAAYLLQLERDPELEATMDRIIDLIAAAQKPDGYLYPSHITGAGSAKDMMGDEPYSFVVHSHELYNMGHLYEAAVAYFQATGKDKLLKVAEKNAQHVNRVFFEGDPNYNGGEPVNQAPGHEEIELALVKLSRVTGNPLYLEMADRFLAIRGRTYVPEGEGVMAPTYAQQHAPVEEQTAPAGHAVRAAYLYSAMADVGVLKGRQEYIGALDAIWRNIVDTRMHITGGLGAVHGIEGFGPEFVLPNKEAYNETCAAVGNVLMNWRLFLLHGDAKYLDVAEVALFNNVLAGVNLEGNRFFYVNPLESDGETKFNHGSAGRKEWFGTACCPTNLARLIPQISGMAYAQEGDAIYCTMYVGSETTIKLPGGDVKLVQETAYPNDGKVRITVTPEGEQRFALKLRIPTWATHRPVPGSLYRYAGPPEGPGWTLEVNGQPAEASVDKRFVTIQRRWREGDVVELDLAMPVRLSWCDERVEANQGRYAVMRGPLVFCAEEADNGPVQALALPGGGMKRLAGVEVGAEVGMMDVAGHDVVSITLPAASEKRITLIPYYAWSNRGEGAMIVWLPVR